MRRGKLRGRTGEQGKRRKEEESGGGGNMVKKWTGRRWWSGRYGEVQIHTIIPACTERGKGEQVGVGVNMGSGS